MSYNVLIVDDSSVVRKMVKKALQMAEVDVGTIEEAGNGREALAVLARSWVDIVFSDIHMPQMDGVALVEEMSRRGLLEGTAVVIISSDRSASRIEHLKHLGVRGYLAKPFRPEALRKIVRELLEGRS